MEKENLKCNTIIMNKLFSYRKILMTLLLSFFYLGLFADDTLCTTDAEVNPTAYFVPYTDWSKDASFVKDWMMENTDFELSLEDEEMFYYNSPDNKVKVTYSFDTNLNSVIVNYKDTPASSIKDIVTFTEKQYGAKLNKLTDTMYNGTAVISDIKVVIQVMATSKKLLREDNIAVSIHPCNPLL